MPKNKPVLYYFLFILLNKAMAISCTYNKTLLIKEINTKKGFEKYFSKPF